MVRRSNPGGDEIFRTCPDRSWNPSSFLYIGYRVFHGGKERPGCDADPSSPSSALVCTRVHFTCTFIELNITIAVRADTSLNDFCDSRLTYSRFIKFGVFRVTMKKVPLEYNMYFVMQPPHFVSRELGLSPFHVYPNNKCHNGSVCTYSHIILVTVLIILLLYDLYNSILRIFRHTQ